MSSVMSLDDLSGCAQRSLQRLVEGLKLLRNLLTSNLVAPLDSFVSWSVEWNLQVSVEARDVFKHLRLTVLA